MASKQYIPRFHSEWVGPDDQTVIPRHTELPVVSFGVGPAAVAKALDNLKSRYAARIEAPCGGGKSTLLPHAMIGGGYEILVHVVPSRVQAASLHRFVKKQYADVLIHFVDSVLDEYPTTGWVITSSAVFVLQSAKWRMAVVIPSVALYMDEYHDPDGATTVIRDLRNNMPGVSVYFEASATSGTGDSKSAFRVSNMPTEVKEIKTVIPPCSEWDLTASDLADTRTPWSFRKATGHFMVFEDMDEHANVLIANCAAAGIQVFRWTGLTSPEKFLADTKIMEDSPDTMMIAIADSTYRSSFSFPTVTRYIDRCAIKVVRVTDANQVVHETRKAFSAEVHQTKCRAGRVAGCKTNLYFRPDYVPENISVRTTGVETHIACVMYRMLGFAPPTIMQKSPLASGKIPRNLFSAMSGSEPLSRYGRDGDWPENAVPERNVRQSLLGDDAISVMSAVSSVETESVVDEVTNKGVFNFPRAKSYVRPSPGVDTDEPPDKVIDRLISDAKAGRREQVVVNDEYYSVCWEGLNMDDPGIPIDPGFSSRLLGTMGSVPVSVFVSRLTGKRRAEVYARVVNDHSDALALKRAISAVLTGLSGKDVSVFGGSSYEEWLSGLREKFNVVNVRLGAASELMVALPPVALREGATRFHITLQNEWTSCLMLSLSQCVVNVDESCLPGVDADAFANLHVWDEVPQQARSRGGRVRGRVAGTSFRAKVANVVLGAGDRDFDVVTR